MENILPWAILQLPSTKSDKSSFKLSLELKKANKVIGDRQERKEEHWKPTFEQGMINSFTQKVLFTLTMHLTHL